MQVAGYYCFKYREKLLELVQWVIHYILVSIFFFGLISFQFQAHSCIGIADKVILFVHNYSSTNILEKLTSVEQLNEASVIEVVVSGMFRCFCSWQLH